MRYLRTNTATRITVGPFLDYEDGVTPETAITVTNSTCELFHDANDGGAVTRAALTLSASGGDNDMVHITDDTAGYYDLELTAANVNWLGRGMLSIIDTDVHLPVFCEITVLPGQVFDSLVLGTDLLDANASQLGGTAQTGRDIGASVLLSSGTGTGQISLSSGAVTAGTVSDKTGYSLAATTGLGNQTANITGNLSGSVGSVSSYGTLVADVASAVATALDDAWIAAREAYWFGNGGVRMIWGALTNGSDTGPTNAAFPDGSFGKKVDDYLNYSISSVASSVSSVLAKLGGWAGTTTDTILGAFQALFKKTGATTPADLGTVFDPETDSLPAVYDKVAALPAASDIKTALEAAGSHLALIKAKTDNLPSDPADDSDIDAAIAALKTILDKLDTAMELDGAVYKFTENALEDAPSGGDDAATVAAAVWDEAKADHTTEGTYGAYLDMAISSIGTGTGDIAFTYTMTEDDEVTPISGVTVKVSTDSAGASMIRQGITDADGEVVFNMDAGTRYFWRYKDGYYFDNPDTEVVSEDA